MSLMKFIMETMKDADIRHAARARPADAARHYGIPEQRVTDYLKFFQEN